MKIVATLITAATMFIFSACANSSENSTTNTDTSTASTSSATAQTPTQDTPKQGGDLMKPMNDMMDKMHSMQMSGDFDVDFANMMIEHHQSGIGMAQVEVSQGKDEKVKAKAQEIITKQQKEQQELRDFVSTYKPSGMKHGEGELQKSMGKMMDKMKSMQMSGDVDKDFLTMMTSHHQDGIDMAKMEVKNGMSDKLKQMAQKSINDQQKDITEFQQWLSTHK
ncbi:MAG: DUF305 domain-containing protein [Flavobacterium sp.]|nr:MAG: DUF305 domain-containing protein [Flavobacterium sp.]